MRSLDFLLKTSEPWILCFGGQFDDIQRNIGYLQANNPGLLIIILEGQLMETYDSLFNELSAKLRFPDYFGKNLDALDECITDLKWMDFDAIVLLIRNAEKILERESSSDLVEFLEILWNAGDEWSHSVTLGELWDRPSIPFHTILVLKDMYKIQQSGFGHVIPMIIIS